MYIELWKWIPGYEGYYMVSTHGRVKSVDRYVNGKNGSKCLMKGKILKPGTDKDGYKTVHLSKNGKDKTYFAHRLVALTFIPNPNNWLQVNHKDEDKTNNHVSNLEWCTLEYNINYGTRNKKQSESMKGRTFTEQHKKKLSEAKKGENGKPILMFTLKGEFIKRFDCIAEANEFLGKDRRKTNIILCASGINKTAYGYIWKYE